MRLRRAWALILCVSLLPGCLSSVVSTQRAPEANLAVRGVRVVFVDANALRFVDEPKSGRISLTGINEQRRLFGNSVIERFPVVFGEKGLAASSRALPSSSLPPTRDFSALFPAEQADWHTLVVSPVSAKVLCSGACTYMFRIELGLVDPATRRAVWSATMDPPAFPSTIGMKAYYDTFVDDLAALVLRQVSNAAPGETARLQEVARLPLPEAPLAQVEIAPPRPGPYARLDDVDAIPYIDERGRAGYQQWLKRARPRAFVISSAGHWNFTSGRRPANPEDPVDPAQRALANCGRKAPDCRLYAIDDRVVWSR